jgi:hypothetical protein
VADLLIIHCSDRSLRKPIRRSISNVPTNLDAGKLVKTSVNHNATTQSLLFLSASKFAAG